MRSLFVIYEPDSPLGLVASGRKSHVDLRLIERKKMHHELMAFEVDWVALILSGVPAKYQI